MVFKMSERVLRSIGMGGLVVSCLLAQLTFAEESFVYVDLSQFGRNSRVDSITNQEQVAIAKTGEGVVIADLHSNRTEELKLPPGYSLYGDPSWLDGAGRVVLNLVKGDLVSIEEIATDSRAEHPKYPTQIGYFDKEKNFHMIPLPPGFVAAHATGVNDRGQIVGRIRKAEFEGYFPWEATFVYDESRGFRFLPRPDFAMTNPLINNQGLILADKVSADQDDYDVVRLSLFDSSQAELRLRSLPFPFPKRGKQAFGLEAMNDSGIAIVGNMEFLYIANLREQKLQRLHITESAPLAVRWLNNAGEMVADTMNEDLEGGLNSVFFLPSQGGAQNLNCSIKTPPGIRLQYGSMINGNRWIVGAATQSATENVPEYQIPFALRPGRADEISVNRYCPKVSLTASKNGCCVRGQPGCSGRDHWRKEHLCRVRARVLTPTNQPLANAKFILQDEYEDRSVHTLGTTQTDSRGHLALEGAVATQARLLRVVGPIGSGDLKTETIVLLPQ